MRHGPMALLVVLLVLAALPGQSASSGSGLEAKIVGRLPAGNYRAASVATGDAVFVFGGRNETDLTSAVVRYDPKTGKAADAGWRLPEPRMSACAVHDGRNAYVFGGANGGKELDTIVQIELATGDIRTLDVRLPSPRIGLSATMYGGMAYVIGGHSNGTMISAILRFDPTSANLSVMGAALPAGLAGIGIASDERGILLFGGNTGSGGTDRVMRYDTGKDELTVLPERLPYPVFHAPAVGFDGKVLLIGGSGQLVGWEVSKAVDTIIEFDPSTGRSQISNARLSSPRERATAASIDGRVVVFGGQQGVRALDEIVVISSAKDRGAGLDGPVLGAIVAVMMLCVAAVLVLVGTRKG